MKATVARMVAAAAAMAMALTTVSTAQAQQMTPADRADVQCFALTAMAADSEAPNSEQMAGVVGGMMYYLGQLRGRSPGTDWLAAIGTYLLSPGAEADFLAQRERCGGEMTATGTELVTWGEALQALGQ